MSETTPRDTTHDLTGWAALPTMVSRGRAFRVHLNPEHGIVRKTPMATLVECAKATLDDVTSGTGELAGMTMHELNGGDDGFSWAYFEEVAR